MAPKNKSSQGRMGLRQHLAWGGETSGKKGVGTGRSVSARLSWAPLWPLRLPWDDEEEVTGWVFIGCLVVMPA